ncbi:MULTISPECIES: hypothetical protein [Mycobacterium]|jgi:hypothetical protein|uniref:Uncharacterized protein n=6 Tax=Mycobacteriaceae TaxID=1762 RepID=D5P563_9MYCO|nr:MULTISPECIES: hypothetical protein [Mycobacterium]AGZ54619.1 hypothetical protein MKAN_29415 [Mycobacterium kansasii ATCC 12478]ARG72345.1 hypothetical protein B1T47_29150 [Mycobacterium kansasii]ARV85486.1 hypothetical protein BWK49_29090 [Mycobacterium intracellulare subsp. chimaera]ASL12393.1 hypothetical protein MYCODSM44623_05720 [Mycobacterium intracellulare subsp. chimaera]ASL24230.1 hypothetical protein MYCOZU1_05869 [Mycobacterium intracellulare subsp. chimaera]
MNDSDQMMALFVAILVMIGLLYLLCRLIYVIVDEAWVAKNAREQQRVQEIRSAQQRSDLLAELREFGLSEEDLDLPHEEIAARVTYAAGLHRQAAEGLGRAGRVAAAS